MHTFIMGNNSSCCCVPDKSTQGSKDAIQVSEIPPSNHGQAAKPSVTQGHSIPRARPMRMQAQASKQRLQQISWPDLENEQTDLVKEVLLMLC